VRRLLELVQGVVRPGPGAGNPEAEPLVQRRQLGPGAGHFERERPAAGLAAPRFNRFDEAPGDAPALGIGVHGQHAEMPLGRRSAVADAAQQFTRAVPGDQELLALEAGAHLVEIRTVNRLEEILHPVGQVDEPHQGDGVAESGLFDGHTRDVAGPVHTGFTSSQ
jgi:hypothetical protein